MTAKDRRIWLWGLAVIWIAALPLIVAFSDGPARKMDADWLVLAAAIGASFLWTKGLDAFDPKLKSPPPSGEPRSRRD